MLKKGLYFLILKFAMSGCSEKPCRVFRVGAVLAPPTKSGMGSNVERQSREEFMCVFCVFQVGSDVTDRESGFQKKWHCAGA